MNKLTLKLLLVSLMVLPAVLSFAQGISRLPVQNAEYMKDYQPTPLESANSIFIEDFSSGIFPPEGWTILGSGYGNWSAPTSNNAGGEAPEARLNWSPQFVGNSKLVTSEIATAGYSSLLLEFKHYIYDYGGGYSVKVETTSDGTTWNEVWAIDVSANVGPETLTLLIDNDDVGSDSFQIAFTFDGDSYQINQWYIDDVLLSEALSWDAGVTAVDIPPLLGTGMNVVPEAKVQNMGAETATFDVVFEILDDGSSIYNETVSVTDLGALEETSVAFPDWIAVEGTYVAQVTVDLTGDENPENDIMNVDFEVMDGLVAKKPLYEEFTSSTCAPCVFANEAIEEVLGANPDEYTLIKYQMNWPGSGDPYYTEEGGTRRAYYGCSWVPDLYINSNQIDPAVSISQEIFDFYADEVTALEIEITEASIDEDLMISVSADLTPLNDYASGLTAHMVVIEKLTVENVGTNGETEFHNVMMKMLPDAEGTELGALSTGVSVSLSESYDMGLTYMETPNDLAVVVFVQDDTDKSIVQSAVIDVESSLSAYAVEITIEDEDGNPIEGAEVSLEANGIQTTNASGTVLYTDVVPGTYSIEAQAAGYYPNSGSVTVIDQDVSVTLTLEAPQYYWFEMFDTEIPSDWTIHVTSPDFLYWYDGKVIFFRQSWTDNPIMLVSPAIDIEPADMIFFDMGEQGNIPQDCAFGTVTDPSDPETFTELALYSPGVDWETFEYDLSNLDNTENEVYFAWKMTAPEACFYGLDNVILTEGGNLFNVDITVENEAGDPIEGADVTLEGVGTQTTDDSGVTSFVGLSPGFYSYIVEAEGYITETGSVQVTNQNVSATIVMEVQEYYWIETFDTEIPSDWTIHVTSPDFLYWYDGKVIFFRQSWTDNPVMLVTPAIDIEPAGKIMFDMGEQGNIPQDCAFGTVTDPFDPETFTELALYTPGVDWETFEYDLSNLDNTENEVYFAWKMTAPEVCFYGLDNVILTFGAPSPTDLLDEDFEEATPPNLPMGWTGMIDGNGGDFLYTHNNGSNTFAILFRQSPSTTIPFILVSPAVDLSNAGDLNFDVQFGQGFLEDLMVSVGTMTDPTDEDTYNEVAQFVIPDTWTGWETLTVDFSTCIATDQHVAFKFLGEDTGVFFHLDNIVLAEGGVPIGKIQGFVRDAETNLAIDEAVITAVNADDQVFTTETPFGSHYSMLLPEGIYSITCESSAYEGSTVTDVVIVGGENTSQTFYLEPVKILTGINDATDPQTNVWPNPAKGEVSIQSEARISQLTFVNYLGQVVYQTRSNSNMMNVNISEFETGIYFIKIYADDDVITRKLVIE